MTREPARDRGARLSLVKLVPGATVADLRRCEMLLGAEHPVFVADREFSTLAIRLRAGYDALYALQKERDLTRAGLPFDDDLLPRGFWESVDSRRGDLDNQTAIGKAGWCSGRQKWNAFLAEAAPLRAKIDTIEDEAKTAAGTLQGLLDQVDFLAELRRDRLVAWGMHLTSDGRPDRAGRGRVSGDWWSLPLWPCPDAPEALRFGDRERGAVVSDLVLYPATPPSPKAARGRPQRGCWPRAERAAMNWLDQNGFPEPGDGGQAALERHVAATLAAAGHEPGESTLRRHVRIWIDVFRQRLGAGPA